jgi:acyl carrier protein
LITDDLKQNIRHFIVDFFLLGHSNGLTDRASLLEKGIIDSTGVLELVAHLEKRYGITISNDEVLPENLDTIDAIAGFLERKQMKTATDFTNGS